MLLLPTANLGSAVLKRLASRGASRDFGFLNPCISRDQYQASSVVELEFIRRYSVRRAFSAATRYDVLATV
jgi:hypothetical protein